MIDLLIGLLFGFIGLYFLIDLINDSPSGGTELSNKGHFYNNCFTAFCLLLLSLLLLLRKVSIIEMLN